MHQIRFWAGALPQTRWGSLHAVLPKSSSYILGVLLLRGGKERTETEKGKKVYVKEKRKKERK